MFFVDRVRYASPVDVRSVMMSLGTPYHHPPTGPVHLAAPPDVRGGHSFDGPQPVSGLQGLPALHYRLGEGPWGPALVPVWLAAQAVRCLLCSC